MDFFFLNKYFFIFFVQDKQKIFEDFLTFVTIHILDFKNFFILNFEFLFSNKK